MIYPIVFWPRHIIVLCSRDGGTVSFRFSLNEKGDRLIEAMLDEEIQELAWSERGFRSGLVGVTIDPSAVNLPFMPETIDNVIGLPSSRTFQRILMGVAGTVTRSM